MKFTNSAIGTVEVKVVSDNIDIEIGAQSFSTQENLSFTKTGWQIKQINTVKVSFIIDFDSNFSVATLRNMLTSGNYVIVQDSRFGTFKFIPTRARLLEKGDYESHASVMLEGEIIEW